jgi:A/G-specific adenine glycosylase
MKSFQSDLLRWYARHRRDLPWRTARLDPYAILVSEFMLQQTQVATVIPYFHRFMERFPTVADLAAASEQHVLRLWQGLGYYSRARNLHAASRRIVSELSGRIPSDVKTLMSLPGVGRYTAGAVASIAFDRRAPILDGNVARVLCRLEKIETDPRDPQTVRRLWQLAEDLLSARRAGDFNSAMMELGATLCTPRNPRCGDCPVRKRCGAWAAGLQEQIPLAKKARPTPLVRRWTFAVRRGDRWLIEQRPSRGRWARLWQFVTVAANGKMNLKTVSETLTIPVTELRPLGQVKHSLTHRRYVFSVFSCTNCDGAAAGRKWVSLQQLARYPMSKPQLRITQMIQEQS